MSLGIGGQFQGKLYVLTGPRDCGAQGVRGKMRDFMGHGGALIARSSAAKATTARPDAPAGISGMGASRASGTGA